MRILLRTTLAAGLLAGLPSVVLAQAPGGAIVGTAWDSLAGRPLDAASVQVAVTGGPPVSATTGADGRFRVAGLPAGRYAAMLTHPRLDALGIFLPVRTVDVSETGEAAVSFGVPSGRSLLATVCPSPKDSTGAVMGVVTDPEAGGPVAGATVAAVWAELVVDYGGVRREQRRVTARSEPGGRFLLCNLPYDTPVSIQASRGRRLSGVLEFPLGRGVSPLEIGLGPALPPADTTPAGRVRTVPPPTGTASVVVAVRGEKGEPIQGARVTVWGTGAAGVTDSTGRVTIDRLPYGSWTVEARRVGLGPEKIPVTLASGQTSRADLLMRPLARTLDVVTVYGKRSGLSSGFLSRQRSGIGIYITKDQIEDRKPVVTSDLLRNIPGVTVRQDPRGYRQQVYLRGGCEPDVVLDGIRLETGADLDRFIRPSELAGVEVHTDGLGAPPQFQRNSCGSILLWTGDRIL